MPPSTSGCLGPTSTSRRRRSTSCGPRCTRSTPGGYAGWGRGRRRREHGAAPAHRLVGGLLDGAVPLHAPRTPRAAASLRLRARARSGAGARGLAAATRAGGLAGGPRAARSADRSVARIQRALRAARAAAARALGGRLREPAGSARRRAARLPRGGLLPRHADGDALGGGGPPPDGALRDRGPARAARRGLARGSALLGAARVGRDRRASAADRSAAGRAAVRRSVRRARGRGGRLARDRRRVSGSRASPGAPRGGPARAGLARARGSRRPRFWSGPSISTIAAVCRGARKRRKIRGVRMAFAVPVSSSSVRKQKPFAVPGRWRTITCPAVRTARPFGASPSAAVRSTPRASSSARRWASTCGPVVTPLRR